MPAPESVQDNSCNKRRDWHDRAAVWAAVAAAVGAGVAAAANGYQAYLTRQNTIVSQRAFVFFDGMEVKNTIDSRTNIKNVSFLSYLMNSGNTATKELTFVIKCASSLESLPDPWVLLYRESQYKAAQVIGPHQRVSAKCDLPLNFIHDVKEGKGYGYLMGDITYRDRLDESILRKTQFSFEIVDINIFDPPAGAPPEAAPNIFINLIPKGRHNCADEDCPSQ